MFRSHGIVECPPTLNISIVTFHNPAVRTCLRLERERAVVTFATTTPQVTEIRGLDTGRTARVSGCGNAVVFVGKSGAVQSLHIDIVVSCVTS